MSRIITSDVVLKRKLCTNASKQYFAGYNADCLSALIYTSELIICFTIQVHLVYTVINFS